MINFDKFLASFITEIKKYQPITCYNLPGCIKKALKDQGLTYKDGEIVKNQRRISAEAKENGYGESEDEEIVKLADEYYDKVLIKECGMEEKEAHHCRIAYIHGAKAMLDWLRCIKQRNTWKPSEEQLKFLQYYADQNNYSGTVLTSLLNDLKKLNQQKSE